MHRYFAATKERTSLNRKIILALGAAETLTVLKAIYLGIPTVRAILAVAKAHLLEVLAARFLVREGSHKIH